MLKCAAIAASIVFALTLMTGQVSAARIFDSPGYGFCPDGRKVTNVSQCKGPVAKPQPKKQPQAPRSVK